MKKSNMRRDKSVAMLRSTDLAYTSLDQVQKRIKERGQSSDLNECRQAIMQDHRYEKNNIYLSSTPFHNVAASILSSRKSNVTPKNDVYFLGFRLVLVNVVLKLTLDSQQKLMLKKMKFNSY